MTANSYYRPYARASRGHAENAVTKRHPSPVCQEAALHDLADRLRRLAPSPRNPDRFHEEKSEIAHALRVIAREVAGG